MQKMNLFKHTVFGLLFVQAVTLQANVFESWDSFKDKLAIVGRKAQYYTPYIVVPVASALIGKCINNNLGVACLGGYIGCTTLSGMYNVYRLKKKYERKERKEHTWHAGVSQVDVFYFARWRQFSEGDGFYWTTAWQLSQEVATVKTVFLKDLYAGKFVVVNAQGQLIASPTPQQVFTAIRDELQELARDKQILASLTNVYYAISRPEEFHPDVSYARFLWPNYNEASRLYIELDVMMKRLEKLFEVVAELRAAVGGPGWPKIK